MKKVNAIVCVESYRKAGCIRTVDAGSTVTFEFG
ncbi:hypothetical protein GGU45_000609 [Niabella hirudinis]